MDNTGCVFVAYGIVAYDHIFVAYGIVQPPPWGVIGKGELYGVKRESEGGREGERDCVQQ